jgi:hypothetical protein
MDSDKTVTANFALKKYTLTLLVDPLGSGLVTGAGSYSSGATPTITATPIGDYEFVNWTGATVGDANLATTTILMDSDKTVTANFVENCDPPCCLPWKADFKTHSMGTWASITDTYFPDVELDDIVSGYNIWEGTGWDGWCVDSDHTLDPNFLYNDRAVECSISLSSDLPGWYGNINWSKINWIINNRDNHTMEDVQDAIWYYTNDLAYGSLSQNSKDLVDGADGTFIPEVGQKYAVILDANIGRCIQIIIIEAIRTCFCEALHQD